MRCARSWRRRSRWAQLPLSGCHPGLPRSGRPDHERRRATECYAVRSRFSGLRRSWVRLGFAPPDDNRRRSCAHGRSSPATKAAGRSPTTSSISRARCARPGCRSGPAAVIDAIRAVEAAGIGSRDDFYWTLHSVFVKKREHRALFHEAFELFWRERGLIEKMLAMLSPMAPPRPAEKETPRPGEARVREAFSAEPAARGQSTGDRDRRAPHRLRARGPPAQGFRADERRRDRGGEAGAGRAGASPTTG